MNSKLAHGRVVTTGGSNRFRVKSDCKNFNSLIVDLLYLEDS